MYTSLRTDHARGGTDQRPVDNQSLAPVDLCDMPAFEIMDVQVPSAASRVDVTNTANSRSSSRIRSHYDADHMAPGHSMDCSQKFEELWFGLVDIY
jgi:hypothetical protein